MAVLRYRNKYSSAKNFNTTKRLKRSSKNDKDSSKACTSKKNVSNSSQCNDRHNMDIQNGGNETDVEDMVHLIVVRGIESERQLRAWHIASVPDDKFEALNSKIKTSTRIELTDYCKILHSGWGQDPPEHVYRKALIEFELPFIKMNLRKLGLNCISIKRIDTPEE